MQFFALLLFRAGALLLQGLQNDTSVEVPITDPRCAVIFVAGYCHSGTSIMQHQLLQKLGKDVNSREPEVWPQKSDKCEGARVYKVPANPTNAALSMEIMSTWNSQLYVGGERYIDRLKALKKELPTAKIIYMCRDLPNTVWSRMQRFNDVNLAAVDKYKQDYCAVNYLCKPGQKYGFLDEVVDLQKFTESPDTYLDPVTSHLAQLALLSDTPTPAGQPSDKNHAARREWQVKQPVYAYNASAYKLEAPADIAAKLAAMSC